MKLLLKQIYREDEHDGFIFMVDEEDESLDISAFYYEKSEPAIEKHPLGFKYHIVTYKEFDDGTITDLDLFEAILGNPWHYIAGLIECGFFGFICKKTENSNIVVNNLLESLKECVDTDDYSVQQLTA